MRFLMVAILLMALILCITTSQSQAGWLIYHKPEFHGRVIDIETKEPIEGAVVAVLYYKETLGPVGSNAYILHARETLTDERGEFHFPAYTHLMQPLSIASLAHFIIYKPGYGSFPGYEVPSGILPKNEEIFFSKEIGTSGELDFLVKEKEGEVRPKFSKVVFGIVGLPKLKTKEERRDAARVNYHDYKLPLLGKALDEEAKYIYGPDGN